MKTQSKPAAQKAAKKPTAKRSATKRSAKQTSSTTKNRASKSKAQNTAGPQVNQELVKLMNSVNLKNIEGHTRRSLVMLLQTGDWTSMSSIQSKAAKARVRDLRKPAFGAFKLECSRNVPGFRGTCYRIQHGSLTKKQIEGVLPI